jgi:hypothetical protein
MLVAFMHWQAASLALTRDRIQSPSLLPAAAAAAGAAAHPTVLLPYCLGQFLLLLLLLLSPHLLP